MSAFAKEAAKACRHKVPKGAKNWSRTLPSINVSEKKLSNTYESHEMPTDRRNAHVTVRHKFHPKPLLDPQSPSNYRKRDP
jgi:hypothetical protein